MMELPLSQAIKKCFSARETTSHHTGKEYDWGGAILLSTCKDQLHHLELDRQFSHLTGYNSAEPG